MKKGIVLLMSLVASSSFFACKNDNNVTTTPTNTIFAATLNGASEKPTSTTSPATGTFTGNLDNTTRVLSYTLNYQGFPASTSVTMGHLHEITVPSSATAGVNGTGGIVVPFGSVTNPIIGTSAALSQAQVDSMKNGFFYANLHTAEFPAGAIRGNLTKQN